MRSNTLNIFQRMGDGVKFAEKSPRLSILIKIYQMRPLLAQPISLDSTFKGWVRNSVADPDPGSGAFLTPGSGIWNSFFPDPRSQTHIFQSLVTIFWVKSSIIP
jgi:hypothetical protein